MLEDLRERMAGSNGQPALRQEIDRRIAELQEAIAKEPFQFDRRFLFRVLVHGALAVRRTDRRARPEHADQCGVRQHHAGSRAWPRIGSAPDAAAA